MASYGCVNYCLDFTDGTAVAYTDTSTNPPKTIEYDDFHKEERKLSQSEFLSDQLDKRSLDIAALVTKIKSKEEQESMPADLSKLVAFGHSFGAMTSIEVCKNLESDFSLCIAIDPFLLPKLDQINNSTNYAIKQPVCLISSEMFHSHEKGGFMVHPFLVKGYDSRGALTKMYNDIKKVHQNTNDYDVTLEGTHHDNMTDAALYMEYLYRKDNLILGELKTKVFIDTVMAYLDEHKFLPIPFGKKVSQVLQGHLKE